MENHLYLENSLSMGISTAMQQITRGYPFPGLLMKIMKISWDYSACDGIFSRHHYTFLGQIFGRNTAGGFSSCEVPERLAGVVLEVLPQASSQARCVCFFSVGEPWRMA